VPHLVKLLLGVLLALIIAPTVPAIPAVDPMSYAGLLILVQEMLVGVFIALVVAGPWMLSVMLDYMRQVFTGIPNMVG